jgi:hypothetical protein
MPSVHSIAFLQYCQQEFFTLFASPSKGTARDPSRALWKRRGGTMRNGADKIIVKLNGDGHYLYFSVRDDRDNRTIIDSCKKSAKLRCARRTAIMLLAAPVWTHPDPMP